MADKKWNLFGNLNLPQRFVENKDLIKPQGLGRSFLPYVQGLPEILESFKYNSSPQILTCFSFKSLILWVRTPKEINVGLCE